MSLNKTKLEENISIGIIKATIYYQCLIPVLSGEGQVIKYLSVSIFGLFTLQSQLNTGPEYQAR